MPKAKKQQPLATGPRKNTRTPKRVRQAATSTPPAPNPRFSTDAHDPPLWQSGLMFGEKFQRFCILASPQEAQALHVLVDLALREVWSHTARTSEGLARLLALTHSDEGWTDDE